MHRTSAQPQVKLSLLRSILVKLGPLAEFLKLINTLIFWNHHAIAIKTTTKQQNSEFLCLYFYQSLARSIDFCLQKAAWRHTNVLPYEYY